MTDQWTTLRQFGAAALVLAATLIAWLAWWLAAVNWRRLWPVLAQGAWLPLVLMLFLAALVWSRIRPTEYLLFGTLPVANYWWQLFVIGLLTGLAFLCGWLQGVLGWTPAEVEVEPPPAGGHAEAHATHQP